MPSRTHQAPPPLNGLRGSLFDFLASNLKGSSLKVTTNSDDEIVIEADKYMRIRISIDSKKKEITYNVYSPEWKRPVRVEELGGFDYMESRIEEELLKLDLNTAVQDALLSVDLLRIWSKSNKYKVEEDVGSSGEK